MKDEIIRMAKEVGFEQISPLSVGTTHQHAYICFTDEIERFYNLAVQHERERIKQANAPEIERCNAHIKALEDERAAMMQIFTDPENQPTQHGTVTIEYMQREIAAEREACAKLCDEVSLQAVVSWKLAYHPEDQGREMGADECAHAIRARGEKK